MLGLGSEAIRMHSCTTNLLQAMQEYQNGETSSCNLIKKEKKPS
jgi:predicted ATP-binding protein involved in virulence